MLVLAHDLCLKQTVQPNNESPGIQLQTSTQFGCCPAPRLTKGDSLQVQIHDKNALMRNTNWTHGLFLKQIIFVNKCYIGSKQNLQLDSFSCVGGAWNPGRSVLLFTFNYTSQAWFDKTLSLLDAIVAKVRIKVCSLKLPLNTSGKTLMTRTE